jgi:hypothetical protein
LVVGAPDALETALADDVKRLNADDPLAPVTIGIGKLCI